MNTTAKILDKITEYAIYGLVFIIPFSKAGIEIFAVLAIIAWLFKQAITYKFKFISYFSKTPLNLPLLALFLVYFTSAIFSADTHLSLRALFSKLSEYILIFFVCVDLFSRKQTGNRRSILLLWILSMSVLLLFIDAGFQLVTGKDFIRDFRADRLRACFSNANDFAGYIIAILPILFCMTFIKFKKASVRLRLTAKSGGLILFLFGLVLLGKTSARGAWLGYLVSFGFLTILSFLIGKKTLSMGQISTYGDRWRVFALLALFFVLIPVVVELGLIFKAGVKTKLTDPIAYFGVISRLYQWKEAIAIIKDFPILGSGLNTYTAIIPKYSVSKISGCYPHNAYLHIAVETGLLGLLAFLWVLWRFFRQGTISIFVHKSAFEFNNYKCMLIGIMACVLATLVHSFFDTNLFALKLVVLFWVMLGIGTARIMNIRLKVEG